VIEIISQIVVCLLVAAFIGFLIGFLVGKSFSNGKRISYNTTMTSHLGAQSNIYNKPVIRSHPRPNGKDDLKQIEGIDKALEGRLNSLGIYHFDQIAKWTPKNCQWIEGYLKLEINQIGDAKWLEQAQDLSKI
jgi:hypothetical protein